MHYRVIQSLPLQLELSGGVVTHHEISYLLRPSPGREYAVKGLATQTGVDLTHSTPVSLGRRPYDWILEAQWQSLLVGYRYIPQINNYSGDFSSRKLR